MVHVNTTVIMHILLIDNTIGMTITATTPKVPHQRYHTTISTVSLRLCRFLPCSQSNSDVSVMDQARRTAYQMHPHDTLVIYMYNVTVHYIHVYPCVLQEKETNRSDVGVGFIFYFPYVCAFVDS